jgi:outer membrane immunogenic protein
MQRILSGLARAAGAALGVAGWACGVSAADLPVKAPPAKLPYNWTGCYLGGTLGWGAADRWNTRDVGNAAGTPFNPGAVNPWPYSLNSNWNAGGTIGCNWQPSRVGLVVGVEGEGGYWRISGGAGQPPGPGGFSGVSDNIRTSDGYALVAGRVGWAFLDTILLYGKVGVAFFDENSHIVDPLAGLVATGARAQSPLAYGGGVEYGFDIHWSGKAEFMWFEPGSTYAVCGSGAGGTFCWKEEPSPIYIFKLGLNYKF